MAFQKISKLLHVGLFVLSLVLVITSSPATVAEASAVPINASIVTTGPSSNDAFDGYKIPPKQVLKTYKVVATAYSSTVEECDADPFITADGSHVRDGIIAANFLPFNTKVRIPEIFGDKVFEVHDRMSSRFWYRVDIWMADQRVMHKFGLRRNVTVEVVVMGDGIPAWKKRQGLRKYESSRINE